MPSMPRHADAASLLYRSASPMRTAIACACVGMLLVYVAGFSQMEALHNGAHDARHAAALPCH